MTDELGFDLFSDEGVTVPIDNVTTGAVTSSISSPTDGTLPPSSENVPSIATLASNRLEDATVSEEEDQLQDSDDELLLTQPSVPAAPKIGFPRRKTDRLSHVEVPVRRKPSLRSSQRKIVLSDEEEDEPVATAFREAEGEDEDVVVAREDPEGESESEVRRVIDFSEDKGF